MPQIPAISIIRVAPDLCVEVLSPHDDVIDVKTKIDEYLQAGVRQVWVVNPHLKTVRVHRIDHTISQFTATDTLMGEDVRPRFAVVVGEFFPPA